MSRLTLLHDCSENPPTNRAKVHPSKKAIVQKWKGFNARKLHFFRFSEGDMRGAIVLKCPKKPVITGILTKRNCTAILTHFVSKLPCSYGLKPLF